MKPTSITFLYVHAGLVGVTAGCSLIEPWCALICGTFAALTMYGAETVSGSLNPITDGNCKNQGQLFPLLILNCLTMEPLLLFFTGPDHAAN